MALPITITDAGRAEIINAQNTGTGPVTITEIGFGTGQYTPTKTRTALQAQVKRVSSIAGQAVAADTIHVTALDESSAAYNVGEFGLFSDKGTLIAVYSQPAASGWIIQKAGPSTLLLATDIILESLNATSITFGDVSFINPPATTTVQGVVELATPEETQAGTDGARAVTPAGLKSLTASTSRAGLVQLNDSLTSSSTTQALTAAQGKKLQDGKQPKDETLTALAALVTAANKLIFATGIDEFATADLTAFARSLLDDPNATAARETLGAAPLDSPSFTGAPKAPTPSTSYNDSSIATTAFVRAAMALFGVGSKGSNYLATPSASYDADSTTDWNTITSPGWWHKVLGSSNPNNPGGGTTFWYCLVLEYGGTGNCTQVAIPYGTSSNPGTLKWRTCYVGTWSEWRELWHTGNLVKQTSRFDTSPGGVLLSGAFGLGGFAVNDVSLDLDAEIRTCTVGCNTSTANRPVAVDGVCQVLGWTAASGGRCTQLFFPSAPTASIYTRVKSSAGWGAWRSIFDSGNVSTFIQTLLDDADAATARATLGANNASNLNTGTVPLAQLPTSVRNLGQGVTTQDPNSAVDPVILSNHTNTPNSGVYWHITTTFWSAISPSANRGQIAVSYNSPTTQVWSRSCFNNVWTPWVRCDLGGVSVPKNTASLGSSGWSKDADTGLIRQWMVTDSIPTNASKAITFPMTFPNACFGISSLTPLRGSEVTIDGISYNPATLTTSGVTIWGTGDANCPVFLVAEGY